MQSLVKSILWVDCIGAILTGVLLLILSGWIAPLYGLPNWFVIGHAFVHLAYGSNSFSLAVRKNRPMPSIKLLVFANTAWAVICLIFARFLIGNGSSFAITHFALDGLYVGTLALLEWKVRQSLIGQGQKKAKKPPPQCISFL